MASICHCSLSSFQGQYLSGYSGYQAIENYPFISLETWSGCGSPTGGWVLSGNVPPGLSPTTPSSQTTTITGTIGKLLDDTVWLNVLKNYDCINTLTQPLNGSDQGSVSITPKQSATLATLTFDFSLDYTGSDSSGSPCSVSFPLTLIVLCDWSKQGDIAKPYIDSFLV